MTFKPVHWSGCEIELECVNIAAVTRVLCVGDGQKTDTPGTFSLPAVFDSLKDLTTHCCNSRELTMS